MEKQLKALRIYIFHFPPQILRPLFEMSFLTVTEKEEKRLKTQKFFRYFFERFRKKVKQLLLATHSDTSICDGFKIDNSIIISMPIEEEMCCWKCFWSFIFLFFGSISNSTDGTWRSFEKILDKSPFSAFLLTHFLPLWYFDRDIQYKTSIKWKTLQISNTFFQ